MFSYSSPIVCMMWSLSFASGVIALRFRCYVKSPINSGESSWFRQRNELNQPRFSSAGLEGLHQVDQIAAIVNTDHAVEKIEGNVPFYIRIGNLRVHVWFGIVENLAFEVLLGTSIIDQGIPGIFPTEHKIFPWHWEQVAIISIKTAISWINTKNLVYNVKKHLRNDASSDNFNLCRIAREEKIPTHTQGVVLASC